MANSERERDAMDFPTILDGVWPEELRPAMQVIENALHIGPDHSPRVTDAMTALKQYVRRARASLAAPAPAPDAERSAGEVDWKVEANTMRVAYNEMMGKRDEWHAAAQELALELDLRCGGEGDRIIAKHVVDHLPKGPSDD